MKNSGRIDLHLIDLGKRIFNVYPESIAFIFVSAIVLWLNLHRGNYIFYYDANDYWNLRLLFDQQQTVDFSLLNFNVSLRGYLLPFMHYVISKLALVVGFHDVILLEIVQALVFSCLITVIIPRTIRILFNKSIDFWKIIIFALSVVFFWQGYFFYPLSDFWALFFFILGVYILLQHHFTSWTLFFVGGCWGAAFLVRPSYSLSIVLLFFWAAIYFYKYLNLNILQLVFKLTIVALGLICISLPQLMINVVHFNEFSFMPQSQLDGGSLYMKQLSWGIEMQRYETFVGEKSDYPSPAVIFVDPHGASILARSGFGPFPLSKLDSFLTLSEYISLVVRHPLDFFVIYLHHLFNGLDIVYNTPYVYSLYQNTILIRLINYSLWFLTILFISRNFKPSFMLCHQFLLLLVFSLPSVLSIPTKVEIRFMLPFYFIAYSIVVFGIIPSFISFSQSKQIDLVLKYAFWYIVFVSVCLILSINTFSNLNYGGYIFW